MAITVKSDNYTNYENRSAFAEKYHWNGRVKSMTDYITTPATGNTSSDEYYFGRLPANAHVIGWSLTSSATSGTGTVTISVGGTAISGAVVAATGGSGPVVGAASGGLLATGTSGADVTGAVGTAAITASKTVRVTVFYVENS